jgi:hypothetical protein
MHRTAASTAIVLRTLCAAAVLACCATAQAQWVEPALQANVSPTSREAQDARFREAMHMHKVGRWSAAYGRFAVLADEGYAPAARVALEMLRNGPSVYGTTWTAAPSQLAAWENTLGTRSTIKMASVPE